MRLPTLFAGLALIACASAASFAQVTFTTNRTSWVSAVGGEINVAQWRYYAAVVEGSDEVASVPAADTDLGQTLSFSTPDLPFQLKAAQPGATLIFREAGWAGAPIDFLSIGKVNVLEDDDLHITFPSGCVRAVGVHLYDNSSDSGEQLRVYDTSGNLIGTRSGLAAFIGITSTIPIGRVEVDESPTADDIGTTGVDIVDCTRPAAVRLINNEAQWHLAADLTGSPEGLPSADVIPSADFVLQADEVLTTPADDSDVGPTLTFSSFDPGFFLQTLQPSAGWIFNDDGFTTAAPPLLSVGRVDVHEDDDFILGVEGCAPSVAFLLEDNTDGADETMLVYDDLGGLMGMSFLPRSAGSIFTGIVASRPIGRVWVDEDTAGDDIALRGLAFIAPLAASPSALDICQGGSGSLSLAAALEFQDPQWRRNGVPLSDGPTASGSVISGSSTATLTIENATLDDAGSYDCAATTACGETIGFASNVRVCVADFDCTGFVDTDDFTAFVLEFELGNDSADVDRTGFVDTDDFTYFVLAFEAGC
ncbi:MAG: hypothetical protein L6Q35_12145 [Phycisphaerales bacterium]|nr:hypothetical protein [Phycisphaerales bacterium]